MRRTNGKGSWPEFESAPINRRSWLKAAAWLGWVAWCAPNLGCRPTESGNGANGSASSRGPLRVVVTVGMVGDLVREVGGPHIAVTQLMGAGVDPHLYKATRDDVQAIMAADGVIYSGLMLEGKLADTLQKISSQKPVFAVTDQLPHDRLLSDAATPDHPDPHVWMDVSAWSECVLRVASILSQLDPAHAADFNQAAEAYRLRLQRLHAYGVQSISTIPASKRVLVTSHDAFRYFGRAYGLEVEGIQGISTESEAGLQRINALVDLLVNRQVEAVFVESSVPRKNVDALVDGVRARGHQIHIGGELFSDAMGSAGTYEGTYEGMLDHNITLVTRSLGGQADPRGLNGKLTPAHSPGTTTP
ncbi:MAG: zinc ABC transporter substrate-binding protein [Pirellulales bacterium]